jgi:LuxR family transcriptional regulator, maltose regulon positive regulatory protein
MGGGEPELAPDNPIAAGHGALARAEWREARACFEAALRQAESAEALEGLGMAAWWQDDAITTFTARERAYHLYRQRGDRPAAARLATYLAYDYYSFRGEYAVANGWFQRARRLLDGLGQVPEQGLLATYQAAFAILFDNDVDRARHLCAQAAAIARNLGLVDIEMLSLAVEGMARVCAGDISDGMRCLDESAAAALSGEMTDLDARTSVFCYLIYACERVRDYDRAAQWCSHTMELASRWNYPLMFSSCRTHYAGVLMWRGEWLAAEAALLAATGSLLASRPAEAADGIVRLAELRRRQGRIDEALTLLAQAEAHPCRVPGEHLALLVRAALALDQSEADTAAELAQLFLRTLPAENQLDRSPALELLALAQAALGEADAATRTSSELRSIASAAGTQPLRAAASFVEATIAAGRADHDAARRFFEDAVDLYWRSGALFEAARARAALARSLLALGRRRAARQQARKALDSLQQLGATAEAERTAALLRKIEAGSEAQTGQPPGPAGLTTRELEVLRLVAAGSSNQEIAAELVLSVRTVERHISNIYAKLSLSGPTSRAAATAFAHRHGLSLS